MSPVHDGSRQDFAARAEGWYDGRVNWKRNASWLQLARGMTLAQGGRQGSPQYSIAAHLAQGEKEHEEKGCYLDTGIHFSIAAP
jgi:hypothetical protein